jgi:hypothetical protein
MKCESWASLLAYKFASPCFGRELKARVVTGAEVGRKQKCERRRRWCLLLFKQKIKIKMQRKEGAYLFSLASTFEMKCSSCLLLSTFFQRWALHVLSTLSSPRSFNVELSMFLQHWALHLPQACVGKLCTTRSSTELWKWSEWKMRWER